MNTVEMQIHLRQKHINYSKNKTIPVSTLPYRIQISYTVILCITFNAQIRQQSYKKNKNLFPIILFNSKDIL